jgi:hypothetical protein
MGNYDPNHATRWRIIYRCCGSNCFLSTDWTDQVGPVQLCGTQIYPPSGGGSAQVHFDSQGNAFVDVPAGRGGVISYNPSGTCHPFTPDGGSVIMIPYQLL